MAAPYTSVSDFFTGRSIFVTGGTGFMGKVLVEKLLRSCPGVKNIYLLMRPKRGQDVNSRLRELLSAPLFNKLRSDREADLKKIVPIQGDITEPELGISGADQQMLAETVSVVFHSAATVKFDEALKLSVTINILGTKRLVNLCHSMRNLEALIHVSTAYCNCDRVEVKEEIYETPYDPDCIIQAMEWMDDDLVNTLTPKLIGNRPNTYTFTKALTEHMLLNICGDLPVAIVRPSIVISSVKDPMAGWVDNWNGPTGIIAAAGKGFFRTMLCHEDKIADLVPVDIVINLMICAAWKTAISSLKNTFSCQSCAFLSAFVTFSGRTAGTCLIKTASELRRTLIRHQGRNVIFLPIPNRWWMKNETLERHVLISSDPLFEGGRVRPELLRLSGEKPPSKRRFPFHFCAPVIYKVNRCIGIILKLKIGLRKSEIFPGQKMNRIERSWF
ncbi:unnamed protein product [Nesidiocoris tenuis]|uniref:Fatty acyl-CoA reductase n=1 Tax=Nesidiocoris tenuis TaxID=355587 RepID=A0A6H5GXS9_9HEMI|nr:unnamed protein product [Nesidiocoris tenuis]